MPQIGLTGMALNRIHYYLCRMYFVITRVYWHTWGEFLKNTKFKTTLEPVLDGYRLCWRCWRSVDGPDFENASLACASCTYSYLQANAYLTTDVDYGSYFFACYFLWLVFLLLGVYHVMDRKTGLTLFTSEPVPIKLALTPHPPATHICRLVSYGQCHSWAWSVVAGVCPTA